LIPLLNNGLTYLGCIYMNDKHKETQRKRIELLNRLHELSNGDTDKYINGGELAIDIGFKNGDEDEFRSIAKYLEDEGLINYIKVIGGFPGNLRISHLGIKEIEKALSNPDQPTDHFMAINVLNVQQMINSNVQQGTTSSVQIIEITSSTVDKFNQFINELEQSIDELQLDAGDKNELAADVNTVKAQLKSPKPKPKILSESLISIKRILEAATGGTIAVMLADKIPYLLTLL